MGQFPLGAPRSLPSPAGGWLWLVPGWLWLVPGRLWPAGGWLSPVGGWLSPVRGWLRPVPGRLSPVRGRLVQDRFTFCLVGERLTQDLIHGPAPDQLRLCWLGVGWLGVG